MILDYPLACYRSAAGIARVYKGLNLNGFLAVWVWLCGNLFKRCPIDGDRMSERFQVMTDCHGVLGPFLNCVRNRAAPRLQ